MPLNRFLTRLILLCVVPLVLLAIVLAVIYVHHVHDEDELLAGGIAKGAMAAIDNSLSARVAGLQVLAKSPLGDDAAHWKMLYEEAQGYRDSFGSHVVLADTSMQMRFNTRLPFGVPLPDLPQPSGRSAVKVALETRKAAVGDPFRGPVAGESLIAIAAPGIRDDKLSHILVTTIETRQFQSTLEQTVLPAGWAITLRDGTDAVIVRHGPPQSNEDAASDGAQRFVVKSATAPWSMVLEIPRRLYYAPAINAIIALVLSILVATALALLGGRWAARRLGASVASLAGPPGQPRPGQEIAEISHARRMLDESLAQRDQAEAARRDGEQRARAQIEEAAHRVALSEARLRGIFDSATDTILTADATQTIVMANPAAARMFRCLLDQLIGAPLERLIPARYHQQHRRDVQAFGDADARTRQMAAQRPVMGLRADGEEFPIEASISQLTVDGQRLYTVILRDITERKRMDAERERLLREQRQAEVLMRESRDQLRELSSALQTIREDEKTRIARELHDELGQALTGLKMDAAAIADELDPAAAGLRKRADDMKQLIDATVVSVRRIAADLRPVILDHLGLVPTLEWLTKDFSQRTGIHADLDIVDETLDVGGDAATAVFRIAQEALTNVARHSGADFVGIELKCGGGQITLRIQDNGKGLTASDSRKARSFGLLGMRERALVLGGEVRISSPHEGGTLIEALIPAFGKTSG